jgi:hypothetical protein
MVGYFAFLMAEVIHTQQKSRLEYWPWVFSLLAPVADTLCQRVPAFPSVQLVALEMPQ